MREDTLFNYYLENKISASMYRESAKIKLPQKKVYNN